MTTLNNDSLTEVTISGLILTAFLPGLPEDFEKIEVKAVFDKLKETLRTLQTFPQYTVVNNVYLLLNKALKTSNDSVQSMNNKIYYYVESDFLYMNEEELAYNSSINPNNNVDFVEVKILHEDESISYVVYPCNFTSVEAINLTFDKIIKFFLVDTNNKLVDQYHRGVGSVAINRIIYRSELKKETIDGQIPLINNNYNSF